MALPVRGDQPPGQEPWFEQLRPEHDNLRGALLWLLDTDRGEDALHLALNLGTLWDRGFHYREGQRWLEEALSVKFVSSS